MWRANARRSRQRTYRPEIEILESRQCLSVASLVPSLQASPLAPVAHQIAQRPVPPPPPFILGPSTFERGLPSKYRLDHHGLLQTRLPSGAGWYYSPTSIARYVQSLYAVWRRLPESLRERPSATLQKLRVNVGWLVRDMTSLTYAGHAAAVYRFPFPLEPFNLPSGWRSALTGANAVTALYLGSLALHNPQLGEAARRLLAAFDVPTGFGGYRIPLGRGATWFEECAAPGRPTPRVLNGHMYALAQLRWLSVYAQDKMAARLFKEGVNGL